MHCIYTRCGAKVNHTGSQRKLINYKTRTIKRQRYVKTTYNDNTIQTEICKKAELKATKTIINVCTYQCQAPPPQVQDMWGFRRGFELETLPEGRGI